jgi:hypothetical protein
MKGPPLNMTEMPEALAEFIAEGLFICFGQGQHTDAMHLRPLRERQARPQGHAGKEANDAPSMHSIRPVVSCG